MKNFNDKNVENIKLDDYRFVPIALYESPVWYFML